MSRAQTTTPRRWATVRFRSADEKRYVRRLLLHLRRRSPFAEAIRKLLDEPTTSEKGYPRWRREARRQKGEKL